jgi:hypothetical protein
MEPRGRRSKSNYETVIFQKYLKMLSVPLLHLETRGDVGNARKRPLSRRCTARNVASAMEARSAGKIILNWFPKTGDRIRGILKNILKRLVTARPTTAAAGQIPGLEYGDLHFNMAKEPQCEAVFTDPTVGRDLTMG